MVTLTTLATFSADREFLSGCYLFTVSNAGLLFKHRTGAKTGFPIFTLTFPSVECIRAATCHPVTLTIELDLASLKINQRDKCLGQRSFRLTVIVGTHTHRRPSALPGPLKWSVNKWRQVM